MRPFLFGTLLLLASCSSSITSNYTNEKLTKSESDFEELVSTLEKQQTFKFQAEKSHLQVVPYTWPLLLDRLYAHYDLSKKRDKNTLKKLFTAYRTKFKNQTCFFVQLSSYSDEVLSINNWDAALKVGEVVIPTKFENFLANKPVSLSSTLFEKIEKPVFGDDPKTLKFDLCTLKKISFEGEMEIRFKAKGDVYLPTLNVEWDFEKMSEPN